MTNTEGCPPPPGVQPPEIVVSTWLSPAGDSPGAFPRVTRSGGFLDKPGTVNRPAHPAVARMSLYGTPSSRLSPEEKAEWEEIIYRKFGVLPHTYQMICVFPHIPDPDAIPHEFDSAELEMAFELPAPPPRHTPLVRLMILQDLKTGSLVRVSLPMADNAPAREPETGATLQDVGECASRGENEPEYTVILPVYNESAILSGVIGNVAAFVRENPDCVFLFVDDGSKDGTGALLESELAKIGEPRLRCLRLPTNGGKGQAVREGMKAAKGRYLLFTDGDLAYGFDHFPTMREALSRSDVVMGSRRMLATPQKNIRLFRRLTGEIFNRLVRLILGFHFKDTQAGLKGFRAEAAREIFSRQRIFDFSFDVELIFIAHKRGLTVAEIPARVSDQHSYKVSTIRMARDPIHMFFSLIKIRWNNLRGRYN